MAENRLQVAEMFYSVQPKSLPTLGCKTYLMSECPVCNDEFKNKRAMKTHAGRVHPNKKDVWSPSFEEKVDCPFCSRKFKNQKGVKIHAGRKHPDKKEEWSDRENRICEVCGDEFIEFPSVLRKCCSEECANIARSESVSGKSSPRYNSKEIECQNCGDVFSRWVSQIEKYNDHFCSKDCHNEWRTGNEAAYKPKPGFKTSDKIEHSVRSGWELGVAEMFVEHGIDYEYEPKMFNVNGEGYVPDFILNDIVIEVKGRVTDGGTKVEKFVQQTDKKVIVIGANLDVDDRYSYNDKEKVLEVLQ